MKRLLFNRQFVNEAGNDLVAGKIHTIRKNYNYWKKYEGQEIALAYWTGKPYKSKQKVFCTKKLVSVEPVELFGICDNSRNIRVFYTKGIFSGDSIPDDLLARNDGFSSTDDFINWFSNYPRGTLAVLHFTEFRYGG